MLIVGLTGGVASGKSTVAKVWQEEGAYVIDADEIARDLVEPHTRAWQALVRTFGRGILQGDGSLDRKALAAIVFSDPESRSRLNRILHPRIKAETRRRLESIGRSDPEAIVVIDAALLVETGGYREVDHLVVVHATEAQQIDRLKKRGGVEREEALRMVSAQMSLDDKLKVADRVIRTEGSLEETKRRARGVFEELKRLAVEKRKDPVEQDPARSAKGGKKRGL